MGEPRNARLPIFGKFLQEKRREAGFKSQAQVAQRLVGMGRKSSQSLIAQYEMGIVYDPDPIALKRLAKLYDVDYEMLVDILVAEKYGLRKRLKIVKLRTIQHQLTRLQKAVAQVLAEETT